MAATIAVGIVCVIFGFGVGWLLKSRNCGQQLQTYERMLNGWRRLNYMQKFTNSVPCPGCPGVAAMEDYVDKTGGE